jgi:uncharacterized membrane protein
MRAHPYVRSALIGVILGILVGVAFYVILRVFGEHANRYLLVAIVVLTIPGYVMLSELLASDELDKADWQEEQQHISDESRTPPRA